MSEPTCKRCASPLPPGKRTFCKTQCSWAWHNAQRKSSPMPSRVEMVEMDEIHKTAQRLIVGGYLPEPYQIDPHDSRPLWDFVGLAVLFDMRPTELVEVLVSRGPVHLAGDRGIPSSWKALVEL